ncbi:hypothetical protein Lalb_Chr17g0337681 [Lupinus albus]|uniref:Uncharacterized protein n=1 Tax=Lupinus albus TaxID=3870 RepID=A0A6A4P4X6_LUPAL|nr:hypothetical protein Lalb_Chr17g0337681 [Lupinus albus]
MDNINKLKINQTKQHDIENISLMLIPNNIMKELHMYAKDKYKTNSEMNKI